LRNIVENAGTANQGYYIDKIDDGTFIDGLDNVAPNQNRSTLNDSFRQIACFATHRFLFS